MSIAPPFSDVLRRVLEKPSGGVVGLVDDLLVACREHGLQLEWQKGACRVRSLGNGSEKLMDVALPKSVFRAILARMAVLCNQRSPNSVSPFGGQGEVAVGLDPATVFRVSFVNTPAEQRFALVPVSPSPNRAV
jgi:hypothetical protein